MERSDFIDLLAIAQSREDIIKSNISTPLTPAEIIVSNFEKGIISEEVFQKGMEVLEKGGKRATLGEIREFGGKKYQKTDKGWRPLKKDHPENNTGEQLQVKPSSFTISGNKASGVIGDKKVSVSLSKDFMNSISSFDDKGVRERVKSMLVDGYKKANSSDSDLKTGQSVKIPFDLTSDPKKKQGQTGKIVSVDSGNEEVTVEFSDGVKGVYQMDVVEKQSSNKEESDEDVAKRSGISVEEYKKLHPKTQEELKKQGEKGHSLQGDY